MLHVQRSNARSHEVKQVPPNGLPESAFTVTADAAQRSRRLSPF